MPTSADSALKDELAAVPESAETTNRADLNNESMSGWGAELFESHTTQATRYAMSIVRCWADAEEIVQESFCKLIESNNSDQCDSDPIGKAILFTTVRNMSIDKLRQQGRRRFEPVDQNQIESTKSTTDEQRLQDLESGIESAMQDLPESWSDALALKVNAGLSYAEIAEVLSATHSQIRTWIFRARKQLQVELEQSGLLGDASP